MVDDALYGELAAARQDTLVLDTKETAARRESQLIDRLMEVEVEALFALELWGRQNGLKPIERRNVTNVAMAVGERKRPSRRDAERIELVLKKAVRGGFRHEGLASFRAIESTDDLPPSTGGTTSEATHDVTLRVTRWTKYGKDRLYVNSSEGQKLGFLDLESGLVTVEGPASETDIRKAIEDWNQD